MELPVGEEMESRVRYVETVVEEMVDNREGVRRGTAILGKPVLRFLVMFGWCIAEADYR